MIRHLFQEIELNKNNVFREVCNLYNLVVKDKEPNGLEIPWTKERKLV